MVMDRNCRVLKFSSIPVNGKLDYVDLLITREDLDEEGLSYMNFGGMPLALTGFATVARAGINWYRLGLFLVCGGGFDRTSLFPGFRGKAHRGWISADLPDVWNNIFTVAPRK